MSYIVPGGPGVGLQDPRGSRGRPTRSQGVQGGGQGISGGQEGHLGDPIGPSGWIDESPDDS